MLLGCTVAAVASFAAAPFGVVSFRMTTEWEKYAGSYIRCAKDIVTNEGKLALFRQNKPWNLAYAGSLVLYDRLQLLYEDWLNSKHTE